MEVSNEVFADGDDDANAFMLQDTTESSHTALCLLL